MVKDADTEMMVMREVNTYRFLETGDKAHHPEWRGTPGGPGLAGRQEGWEGLARGLSWGFHLEGAGKAGQVHGVIEWDSLSHGVVARGWPWGDRGGGPNVCTWGRLVEAPGWPVCQRCTARGFPALPGSSPGRGGSSGSRPQVPEHQQYKK